jgi:hypothetical protein
VRRVARSSVSEARERLGWEPLEFIFEASGAAWCDEADEEFVWRGLSVYGTDGTTLRVADSEENVEAFGLPDSGDRGRACYPQIRLVALLGLHSRVCRAARFGPYSGKGNGELSLAKQLWDDVPDHSLLVADKNFAAYGLLYRLQHDEHGAAYDERHWLTRPKSNAKTKTVEVLPDGTELVELRMSPESRKQDPTLPEKMTARLITAQVKGFRPWKLLTSLVDHERFPAHEIAQRYHERWECELGYDELKTDLLDRRESLRSKKPDLVRQEVWGVLIAYNLIRRQMARVAEHTKVSPARISFRNTMHFVRAFCLVEAWSSAPGNVPKRLDELLDNLALFVLPERRTERRYPRQVKIKMSKFIRNTGKTGQPAENQPSAKK